jgi:hypothetical protein
VRFWWLSRDEGGGVGGCAWQHVAKTERTTLKTGGPARRETKEGMDGGVLVAVHGARGRLQQAAEGGLGRNAG